MNELGNMVLFDLLYGHPFHRRINGQDTIIWPRTHPCAQSDYDRVFRQTIDDANRVNQHVAEYLDNLNCQRHPRNGGNCRFHAWPGNCDDGLRDLVQPTELPAGRNRREGNFNSFWQALEEFCADVCVSVFDGKGMEHEVRATSPGYKSGDRSRGFADIHGPRPRTPVPFAGDYH